MHPLSNRLSDIQLCKQKLLLTTFPNKKLKLKQRPKEQSIAWQIALSSFILLLSVCAMRGQETTKFSKPGSWIFFPPAGVTTVSSIKIWGAGGAGGGSTNTSFLVARGGAGGGGGGFCTTGSAAVSPTLGTNYSVGLGGSGISGENGTDGSATSFGSLTANGGKAGAANTTDGTPAGGAGGTASGGTTNTSGSDGNNGASGFGISSGKGGDAAGTGGGTGGAQVNVTGDTSAGNNGAAPGGGGGGGRTSQNGGSKAGGNGGNGQISISYTCPTYSISNISATSSICRNANNTISVNSTAAGLPVGIYSVTYNTTNPVQAGLTATMTVSIAGSGTFTATGFDTNGTSTVTVTALKSGYTSESPTTYFCSSSTNVSSPGFTVKSSTAPTSISGTTTLCSGSSTTLTQVGGSLETGANYKWFTNSCGSTPLASGTSISVSPISATTYYVRAEGSCGNTACASVNVSISPPTIAGSISGDTTVCSGSSGGTLTLSGHNGSVIKWQSAESPDWVWTDIGNTSTTYTSGPLTKSTKFRAVVQSGGCSSINSDATTVTVTAPATPIVNGTSHPTCSQATGTATLSNLPGGNWTINPGSFSGTGATATVSSLAPGTYSFTVTDASGCTSAGSSAITVNEGSTVPAIPTIGNIVQPVQGSSTGSFEISNFDSSCSYNIVPATGVSFAGNKITAPVGNYTLTATLGSCTSAVSETVSILSKTKTWNGNESPDWFADSNWSPAGVPASDNDVIIPSNVTHSPVISGANTAFAYSLSVLTGGLLEVAGDNILNLTDSVNISTGGTLNLLDSASLIQTNNTLNTGNINVYRNTANLLLNDYTYWSAPTFGTQTLQNFSPNSNLKYFLSYNNGWSYANPAKTTFVPGIGYAILAPKGLSNTVAVSKTFRFTGTPNNGPVTLEVTKDSNLAFSSRLVGNPYPSALDADKFILANLDTTSGTLYFWTHNNALSLETYSSNDTAFYNLTGGTRSSLPTGFGHANTSTPQQFIASCQGFIVEVVESGNLVFTNDMRICDNTSSNGNFYKNANGKSPAGTAKKSRLWLNFSNNSDSNFSQLLLGYIDKATNGFDKGFDGKYNSNSNTGLYSLIGNEKYAIQGRALPFTDSDIVPIGYTTDIKGNATISIDTAEGIFDGGQSVFIEDLLLNKVHNLNVAPYIFATEAGTFDNRFVLRYTNNNLGTNDLVANPNKITVSSKNHLLKIRSDIELFDQVFVYDILGKELYRNLKVDTNEITLSNIDGQQLLVVKMVLENGKTVARKVAH